MRNNVDESPADFMESELAAEFILLSLLWFMFTCYLDTATQRLQSTQLSESPAANCNELSDKSIEHVSKNWKINSKLAAISVKVLKSQLFYSKEQLIFVYQDYKMHFLCKISSFRSSSIVGGVSVEPAGWGNSIVGRRIRLFHFEWLLSKIKSQQKN